LQFDPPGKQLTQTDVFSFMFQKQSFRVKFLLKISDKAQFEGIQSVCQDFSDQFLQESVSNLTYS
jgi:hypothetical protein